MIINSTGNVGIGTTGPNAKLDVNGVVRFNHNGAVAYTLFQNSNEINTYVADGNATGLTPSSLFIQAAQGGITRVGKDNLVVNSNYTGSSVSGLTITTASNVGIGVALPDAKLHVVHKNGFDLPNLMIGETTDTNGRSSGIAFKTNWSGQAATSSIVFDYYGTYFTASQGVFSHGLNYVSGRSSFSNHIFRDASLNIQMIISRFGNVGIGATGPNAKLDVAGSINILSGLNNASPRPALSAGTLTNGEIRAYSVTASTQDDGFLRISAGGGTNPGSGKTYIDITGYSTVDDMNNNVVIGTRGTERMRVDRFGNVGISNNNPNAKLHIFGDTNGNNPGGAIRIQESGAIGTTPSATFSSIVFAASDNSTRNYIATINSSSAEKDFIKIGSRFGNIEFTTGDLYGGGTPNTTRMIILNDGKVGIGTTSPIAPLNISDGNIVSTSLYTSDYLIVSAQNTAPGFNIVSAGSDFGNRVVFKATRSRGTLSSPTVPLQNDQTFSLLGAIYDGVGNFASAAINFDVDGAVSADVYPQRMSFWTGTGSYNGGQVRQERMRIDSVGNVGIGTQSPGAKLHVSGNVILGSGDDTSNYATTIICSNDITNPRGLFVTRNLNNQGLHIHNGDGGQVAIDAIGFSPKPLFIRNRMDEALVFSTNNTDRMYISASGSVGVGTSSPSEKLEVNGRSVLSKGNYSFIGPNVSTSPNNWYKVFSFGSADIFDYGTFKMHVSVGGPSTGEYILADVYINYKQQNTNHYASINIVNYGNIQLKSQDIEILRNDSTSIVTLYHRPTINYQIPFYTYSGSVPLTLQNLGALVGANLNSEVNNTWFEKSITMGFTSHVKTGNFSIGTTNSTQKLNVGGAVTADNYYYNGLTYSSTAIRFSKIITGINTSSYTSLCNIEGDALSSSIRISILGTTGSSVVNIVADILVNHSGDIYIESKGGLYNAPGDGLADQNFTIQAKRIVGDSINLNVEVFPLNSENVIFENVTPHTGASLIHRCVGGFSISATGEVQGQQSSGNISASGRVGIGTNNPLAKLYLSDTNDVVYSSTSSYAVTDNTYNGVLATVYNLSQATGSYAGIKFITRNTGAKKWGIYNVSKGTVSADLTFGHGHNDNVGSEVMRITDTNNVGIGITEPSSKLHIYGTSSVFKVDGANGDLFNINDSATGTLFSVNDISGLSVMEIFDDGSTILGNSQAPSLYTTKKVIVSSTGNNIIHTMPIGEYNSFFFDYSIQSGGNLRAGTNIVITNGTTTNSTDLSTLDIGNTNTLEFDATVSGPNLQLRVINTTPNWTIKLIIRTI